MCLVHSIYVRLGASRVIKVEINVKDRLGDSYSQDQSQR